MKRISQLIFLIIVFLFCNLALAADKGIDGCIEKIKQKKKGNIVKIESLNMGDKLFYEVEVQDDQNSRWDMTCDTSTFQIIEIEEKFSSSDSNPFKKEAKLSEKQAVKIALNSYPGKVVEIEYEIKDNGTPTYEIDINGSDGRETKIEVNAVSGSIDDPLIEKWEVGVDAD